MLLLHLDIDKQRMLRYYHLLLQLPIDFSKFTVEHELHYFLLFNAIARKYGQAPDLLAPCHPSHCRMPWQGQNNPRIQLSAMRPEKAFADQLRYYLAKLLIPTTPNSQSRSPDTRSQIHVSLTSLSSTY